MFPSLKSPHEQSLLLPKKPAITEAVPLVVVLVVQIMFVLGLLPLRNVALLPLLGVEPVRG